jgi:hypothetical protein
MPAFDDPEPRMGDASAPTWDAENAARSPASSLVSSLECLDRFE